MPKPASVTDAQGLVLLAEMARTNRSLRATAKTMGLSEDAAQRWKTKYDKRVAAGEIQPYRPNLGADIDAAIARLKSVLAEFENIRRQL